MNSLPVLRGVGREDETSLPRVTQRVKYPSREDLWPADVWEEMQRIARGEDVQP